jgi:hypothetical protein
MQRRQLGIATAALAGGGRAGGVNAPTEQVVIERSNADQPNRGKVLALIAPHLDDGPIFAGGTLAKLLSEGYSGYFIRTSNDEKDSYHLSLGETVLANERDTAKLVKTLGFKKSRRLHRKECAKNLIGIVLSAPPILSRHRDNPVGGRPFPWMVVSGKGLLSLRNRIMLSSR